MDAVLEADEKPASRMKIPEVMQRASFLKINNKMIMRIDLSKLKHVSHVTRIADYLVTIVEKLPRQFAVGLVDFRGLLVSDEVKQELTRLATTTYPYFRAGAMLVDDDQSRELADTFTERLGTTNINIYDDEETAKNWLISK